MSPKGCKENGQLPTTAAAAASRELGHGSWSPTLVDTNSQGLLRRAVKSHFRLLLFSPSESE